jgi:hypothetical protein
MDRWIAASEYDALFECLFDRRLAACAQGRREESEARKVRSDSGDTRERLKER